MADISGTAGADVLTGTTSADVIDAGEGNDRITGDAGDDIILAGGGNDNANAGIGNDQLFGGAGNDSLTGDAGNDQLFGEDGNDQMYGGGNNDTLSGGNGNDLMAGDGADDVLDGGAGNDTMYGGLGNDVLYGGFGNDILNGDGGNDVLKIRAGEGQDTLHGGAGIDTVVLDVTAAQVTPGFRADMAAYNTWMQGLLATYGSTAALSTQTTSQALTLSTVGVTMNFVEGLTVMVDGVATPLSTFLNQSPVAETTSSISTDEDMAVSGAVAASDPDNDVVTWTLGTGPAHGSLSLDGATGQYLYTPNADFNGSDAFTVTVADPAGGSVTQTVSISVAAVNDAPVAEAAVSLSATEDSAASGQVSASDLDGDTLSYSVGSGPSHGLLALDGETGAYTYTGAAGFSGSDSFLITIADGQGGSVSQEISVTVGAVADAPVLTVSDSLGNAGAPGNGNGTYIGGQSDDHLSGGAGNDQIAGGNGNDTLLGDAAPPVTVALSIAAALEDIDGSESLAIEISGVPEGATLSAGTSNGAGAWSLSSGQLAGLTMTMASAADVMLTVTAIASEAAGGSAEVTRELAVTFSGGTGADGADTMVGGAGNDTLAGGGGDDVMYGGSKSATWIPSIKPSTAADDDVLSGGDGNDQMWGGNGNDVLHGDDGNDVISGGKGSDRIEGGQGNDTLKGDSGNDIIDGGDGNDSLKGSSGNDTLSGGGGDDKVDGGSGNDHFIADAGDDTYIGGSGNDTLDYSGAASAISVDVSKKTVTGLGADTFSGIEEIIGSDFADTFMGSTSADRLAGGGGGDYFRGKEGADVFTGGDGADTWEWFVKDVLVGKNHQGVDTITDFGAGDVLDLTEFTKAFKNTVIGNIVQVDDTSAGSMVSVKIGADFVDLVMLEGVHGVSAGDLLASGMILA